MTDRNEPDLYSHWTWGTSAPAHEIDRLHSVCTGTGTNPTACTAATGYAESESYDNDGRLAQRSIAIPGDTTYTYTWSYSATTGLLDTLTYPADSFGHRPEVKYGYAYGQLQSITDVSDSPNISLWTGNFVDASGNYTQETLGNGMVIAHAYDPVTGMLKVSTGPAGSANQQNDSYLYDSMGNLTQRQDNNAGKTESAYYDNVNRLSHTVGDTSTNLTYDAMGRLATWEASGASTNVNDYTTAQPGCTYYANAQPHALRGNRQGTYPPSSFCYDANGNMTTVSSGGTAYESYSWTSFNQPNILSAPGYNSSSQFFYDQNHQRYKQVASYGGSAETTEYIGGLMEKMTGSLGTSYRYYVPAGSSFVVYNRWTNGFNTIFYATRDNLGSTAIVMDQGGAAALNEKFAALGWNESGSNAQSLIPEFSRHEYTGHEGLDNPGLWMVNMNGRIYIPSGSMFLSPDPTIPDPARTTDYNRYSYVENNPLTYVDPTGFTDTVPFPGPGAVVNGSYDGGSDATPAFPGGGSTASQSTFSAADVNDLRNADRFDARTANQVAKALAADLSPPSPAIQQTPPPMVTVPGLQATVTGLAPAAANVGFIAIQWNSSGITQSAFDSEPNSAASRQQSKPQGPSDPYTCAKLGIGCQPQTPPTPCLSGGGPSINNNPNLSQNEKTGTALGVSVGVVAGMTLALAAPELEVLDALHLAPYAAFSGGGAGGAGGFAFGAATTAATCPASN